MMIRTLVHCLFDDNRGKLITSDISSGNHARQNVFYKKYCVKHSVTLSRIQTKGESCRNIGIKYVEHQKRENIVRYGMK